MQQALAWLRRTPAAQTGLMITPVSVWLGLFLVVPLGLVLLVSFMKRGTYGGVVWEAGLHNYLRFMEPIYLEILADSLGMAFLTTVICLVFGYPFAYLVAQAPPRRRGLYLMLVIIPFWTNFLVRTYAWMIILRSTGLVNTVLLWLGVIQQPLELLFTRGAVLLGLVYAYLPFMVLPLYASIEKLDRTLLEAASDLGANPVRAFLKVTLPLTLPGIVAGSILVFIPALGMFVIPDLLGGAKAVMIGNLIQNQFKVARNWPFGSAASIVLMALALALIFGYVRLFGFQREEERRA